MSLLDKILIAFLAFVYGIMPGVLMHNAAIAIAGGAANIYLTLKALRKAEEIAKKAEKLLSAFA